MEDGMFGFGVVAGVVGTVALFGLLIPNYFDGHHDGVIAHASGQYTATLVENPDKTTKLIV
jgi:hypothetical protein